MPQIVKIKCKDGKAVVTVEGVSGAGCHDLTAELVRKLGEPVSQTNTPEYYEAEQSQDRTAEH